MAVHARTCRRALDQVKALRGDAVYPAKIQRYLIRWATWWHHTEDLSLRTHLKNWIEARLKQFDADAWLGAEIVYPWSTTAFDLL